MQIFNETINQEREVGLEVFKDLSYQGNIPYMSELVFAEFAGLTTACV